MRLLVYTWRKHMGAKEPFTEDYVKRVIEDSAQFRPRSAITCRRRRAARWRRADCGSAPAPKAGNIYGNRDSVDRTRVETRPPYTTPRPRGRAVSAF